MSARAVLATIGHHLPYGRAAKLLAQLAGLDVSTGFLVNARRRAATLLTPFMTCVGALLHAVGLLHVDETTARVEGGLAHLHVACNDDYTVMHTGGRTNDDIDAGGVLVDYAGIIVRDGYAGYQHLVNAVHVWCGAHTLRDLKGLYDGDPEGQPGAKSDGHHPYQGATRHPQRPCSWRRLAQRRAAIVSAVLLRRCQSETA